MHRTDRYGNSERCATLHNFVYFAVNNFLYLPYITNFWKQESGEGASVK